MPNDVAKPIDQYCAYHDQMNRFYGVGLRAELDLIIILRQAAMRFCDQLWMAMKVCLSIDLNGFRIGNNSTNVGEKMKELGCNCLF